MPKPPMPARAIRIPDKLWAAAKLKADAEDSDVSTEIRRLLEEWVRA